MKPNRKTNIALIGFQCSGKTTLGAELAKCLNKQFIDTDQLIEIAHSPLTCRDIHLSQGEKKFREIEKEILTKALEEFDNWVFSLGGGTLLHPHNGKQIKQSCTIIYLKTSPLILKQRIRGKSGIPSFLDPNDFENSFQMAYEKRTKDYELWADYIIEMNDLNTIEQSLDQVLCITLALETSHPLS